MESERIDSVRDWPRPQCVCDVQIFIAFANFYRRFIQGFSKIARPLTAMMKSTGPTVITRPDIAFATSKLSEHLTNPSPRHLELVTRVIAYLIATRMLCAVFDGQINSDLSREVLLVSSDASFADDLQTRFSSQGYALKLFGGLIDWKANKQKTVTLSSTEAKLLLSHRLGKKPSGGLGSSVSLSLTRDIRSLFSAIISRRFEISPLTILDSLQSCNTSCRT